MTKTQNIDEQSLTSLVEVTYDYDEDEDGETVEQVIIDGTKYIDIEYFRRKINELKNNK